MQRTIIIMVVIIFVLALCPGAFAQQQTSMRCGNLFVKEGLSSLEVLAGCGEPVPSGWTAELGAGSSGPGSIEAGFILAFNSDCASGCDSDCASVCNRGASCKVCSKAVLVLSLTKLLPLKVIINLPFLFSSETFKSV